MFAQVKGDLVGVSEAPYNVSYARLDYHQECEAAVNEQINIEYTISYVYHSLFAFFDRDNVGAHHSTLSISIRAHPTNCRALQYRLQES